MAKPLLESKPPEDSESDGELEALLSKINAEKSTTPHKKGPVKKVTKRKYVYIENVDFGDENPDDIPENLEETDDMPETNTGKMSTNVSDADSDHDAESDHENEKPFADEVLEQKSNDLDSDSDGEIKIKKPRKGRAIIDDSDSD